MSMKGYMTVRNGLTGAFVALRCDPVTYPVNSSHFLAIIIVLAGLRNIPRIDEIKKNQGPAIKIQAYTILTVLLLHRVSFMTNTLEGISYLK